MTKDEIIKIVTEAIENGLGYTLEECNTGDCTLTLPPISFRREIPPPPIDPNAHKFVILRGDESFQTRERIKRKYGGKVEFLPSCTEIVPFSGMQCEIRVDGRVRAYCDQRDVLISWGEPE